eukprot:753334-Rhodomonas_salina.2
MRLAVLPFMTALRPFMPALLPFFAALLTENGGGSSEKGGRRPDRVRLPAGQLPSLLPCETVK